MPVAACRRSETAWNVTVEVHHIVVPAKDKLATAGFLADVLGLEAEAGSGECVRIRGSNGLAIDLSRTRACWAFQCAFLVSSAEFDAALSRIGRGTINFYSSFDGTGRSEINRSESGGRRIYFDDPEGHLFELIEQEDASAAQNRIMAVAIKVTATKDLLAARGSS
jgi:catechol 2,3-dioxygenase-like lactoylglutathione lyase family enzyme